MIDQIKRDILHSVDKTKRFNSIVFGFYIVDFYVLSLREAKELMVDLVALAKCLLDKKNNIIIELKEKVKGQVIESNHLFPCVKFTSGGLDKEL